MKKYIKYILTPSIFIAQNLFAQSGTDTEGMDMSVYATWMGSTFLVFLFIMIGVFLFNADKEDIAPENTVPDSNAAFGYERINFVAAGSSLYLLPGISLELNRIKILIVSALITFSLILLLLIIQK